MLYAIPPELLTAIKSHSWASTAVAGLLVYMIIHQIQYYAKTPKVASVGFVPIPILGSWIAAIRLTMSPAEMIRQGMAKSKNGMFRVATLAGEFVLVVDRHKVSEYLKAPDTVLNAQDGANEQQQLPHTMGYGVAHRTYHTAVVRGPITKDIPIKTDLMVDEAQLALNELIGDPADWTPTALYDNIALTVARISSRLYVGMPFCRDKEYLKNSTDYAQAVVLCAEFLRLLPEWSKGFVTRFLPVTRHRKAAVRTLGSFIQERLDGKLNEDGTKPDDLVQRLIDAAPPIEKTVPQIAERVMALNVASIHTTTMVFTAALYTLAEQWDKYAEDLRQEIESHIPDGEITFDRLKGLVKMDSFLRESGRFNVAGLMAMQRNARKDFTFSDGTVLPRGAKVGAPTLIMHRDAEVYSDPDVFDGYRFLDERYIETKETGPTTTGRNYHVFGHGRHPCPGRFLATHEMKILFCILLMKYDFKFAEGDGPKPMFIALMAIPDTFVKVQFRLRR